MANGIHPVSDHLNEGWTFSKMWKQLKNPTCTIETLGPPPNPNVAVSCYLRVLCTTHI
jgi:hypothetical protein